MTNRIWIAVVVAAGLGMTAIVQPTSGPARAADAPPPKTGFSCSKCPEGYAIVGRSTDAKVCPDDDHTVLQCASLGVPRLAVCGTCPDGYVQVGSSNLPARCGSVDGGQMSQCQLQDLGAGLPGAKAPTMCPPDCGTAPPPKEGGGPVPQYRDLREKPKPADQ
jgi:hypothetical protein